MKKAFVDFHDVCILYSMLNLNNNSSERVRRVFGYLIEDLGSESHVLGSLKYSFGKARVTFLATLESRECVHYSHSISGRVLIGASTPPEGLDLRAMHNTLRDYVSNNDFTELEKFIFRSFSKVRSFSELRRDFQNVIISSYFSNLLDRVHEKVKEILTTNYSIARSAVLSRAPFLDYFKEFIKLYVTYELRELLNKRLLDSSNLSDVLTMIKEFGVELPNVLSELDIGISNQLRSLVKDLNNLSVLENAEKSVSVLKDFMSASVARNLWRTRATVCLLMKSMWVA